MKKIFSFLLALMISQNVFAYTDWAKSSPAGTDSPSSLDTLIQANNTVLDDFLEFGRFRLTMTMVDTNTIQIRPGSIACSNSTGTVRRLRKNTASTTVTWTDIDTGSEDVSTPYYVYAVADADASTCTFKISANGTAPSGCTYYQRLGYFYNDASGNITSLMNYTNSITVSTGTVADGGTIPLPLGASTVTSFWIVSPQDTSSYLGTGYRGDYSRIKCYASASRVVTAKVRDAYTLAEYSINANYMLISINQD
jgi:hypothetical protein